MTEPTVQAAFRDLRHALRRRRLDELDTRLRVELGVLALLVTLFLFWQARVGLDSLARAQGPVAVVIAIMVLWMVLAVAGGVLAGARHALHLRHGPPGPAWLSLPLPPEAIVDQVRWESRMHALWTATPVPGVLAAVIGLMSPWWIAALALGFAAMLHVSGAVGCAIAYRVALHRAQRGMAARPIVRLLADAAHPAPKRAGRTAHWRGGGAVRALWSKDALLARRCTAPRRRLVLPLLLAVLSVLAWSLPIHPGLARFFAFGLALMAAATYGEWLIALGGEDPFAILRTLPVSARHVWMARALWALLGSVVLVIAQGIAARHIGPLALQFHLVWLGGAALVIALLAVNYGMTLYPEADVAQRFLLLSLGLSGAASLMIPLLGWVVLLAGFIHSARRLPRWSRLEEAS